MTHSGPKVIDQKMTTFSSTSSKLPARTTKEKKPGSNPKKNFISLKGLSASEICRREVLDQRKYFQTGVYICT